MMNFNKFTIKAQEAVQAALELAQNENHQAVEPAHILKALLTDSENVTVGVLKKLGVSVPGLISEIDKIIKRFPIVKGSSVSGQYLSNQTKELFDTAQKEADALSDEYISSEHILLAVTQTKSETSTLTKDRGVSRNQLLKILKEAF